MIKANNSFVHKVKKALSLYQWGTVSNSDLDWMNID